MTGQAQRGFIRKGSKHGRTAGMARQPASAVLAVLARLPRRTQGRSRVTWAWWVNEGLLVVICIFALATLKE